MMCSVLNVVGNKFLSVKCWSFSIFSAAADYISTGMQTTQKLYMYLLKLSGTGSCFAICRCKDIITTQQEHCLWSARCTKYITSLLIMTHKKWLGTTLMSSTSRRRAELINWWKLSYDSFQCLKLDIRDPQHLQQHAHAVPDCILACTLKAFW